MRLLFDSFLQAARQSLQPHVILLSLAPLGLIAVSALALHYFYWADAVALMARALDSVAPLSAILSSLESWGFNGVVDWLAPLAVVFLVSPVLVLLSLVVVALFMAPALLNMVAARRFPTLVRRGGASFFSSVWWSIGSTLMALAALIVSMPLWLIPPLILVLPPLIWGWLGYRVMSFDALAEHATANERLEIFKKHRSSLLCMGILTGYLGAAPGIVWASGVVFAAAFVVLIPLAIWIYTLVFAFSSLWFTHYCLSALAQLRAGGEHRSLRG
jgi:hypothetical protein